MITCGVDGNVALAGGIGYVVFDGKELRDRAVLGPDAIPWSKVTTDCSSASTGPIGVYDGATKLGTITTSRQLYPAEAEPIDFVFTTAPANVTVKIDDGAPAHPSWTECRTDDNTATITVTKCGGGVN